uniref:protein-tyrosine-phosphatase n=1 Tax=Syphacia muris TaxID=451379 RepID=A0A0N5AAC6_9BILA
MHLYWLSLQSLFSSSPKFLNFISEGFVDFREKFPDLCESSNAVKTLDLPQAEKLRPQCVSLPNISNGPTKILPFLYLGSEQDALDSSVLNKFNIQYIINISVNCPQPEAVKQEGHFMRIPINDSYGEKLLPYFEDAFKFLDKVKEIGSTVLIHCLAGISRSPTLAIAYVMKKYRWPAEKAYRFVKEKRPSVAPNFDFMGQLLDFENLKRGVGSSMIQHYECSNQGPSKSVLLPNNASESLRSSTLAPMSSVSLFNPSSVSQSLRKSRSEHECSSVSSESGFIDVDEYGKSIVQNQASFSGKADAYRDSDHESLGSATTQEISVI